MESRWDTFLRLIYNNVGQQQFTTWFTPIRRADFDEEKRELIFTVVCSGFVCKVMEKNTIALKKIVKKMGKIGILLIFPIQRLLFSNPVDAWLL